MGNFILSQNSKLQVWLDMPLEALVLRDVVYECNHVLHDKIDTLFINYN